LSWPSLLGERLDRTHNRPRRINEYAGWPCTPRKPRRTRCFGEVTIPKSWNSYHHQFLRSQIRCACAIRMGPHLSGRVMGGPRWWARSGQLSPRKIQQNDICRTSSTHSPSSQSTPITLGIGVRYIGDWIRISLGPRSKVVTLGLTSA